MVKNNYTQGKIIKGIAGFYYVNVIGSGIYECKAKGIFRKEKKKPLVGDVVDIEILDEEEKKGNITYINPRSNELYRPAIANVDQALVVFSVVGPRPNLQLLNKFLVMMESNCIPTILCFNKKDIAKETQIQELEAIYAKSGYQVLFTSVFSKEQILEVSKVLKGKTTVIAGPSGVGKSSIINLLQANIHMETGEISRKIGRGKHTTRHAELIAIDEDSYIADTPGFSSLLVDNFEKEDLRHYYQEFIPYEGACKFQGCSHIHEPNCAVQDAVQAGEINDKRYKSYVEIYKEIEEKKRY